MPRVRPLLAALLGSVLLSFTTAMAGEFEVTNHASGDTIGCQASVMAMGDNGQIRQVNIHRQQVRKLGE